MHKVFTVIIYRGILPALSEHILSASLELGIIENQTLRSQSSFLESLTDFDGFEVLSCILPMCTGQDFFQTLCTRVVESALHGMVPHRYEWYIFVVGL